MKSSHLYLLLAFVLGGFFFSPVKAFIMGALNKA
jgi:hypothetical protein